MGARSSLGEWEPMIAVLGYQSGKAVSLCSSRLWIQGFRCTVFSLLLFEGGEGVQK